MIVQDFLNIIYDGVGTAQDYASKSVNPLFTNAKICRQLKFALDKYASYTKALEAYHSLPVGGYVASIALPDFMLRSEGIRFLVWFINGYAYPLKDKNLNNTWGNFPVPIQGLPRWFNIWEDRINFYPQNSTGFNTASLTADITETDTTIPVDSTAGFTSKNGRFTLGSEIIQYTYLDATNFYGCRRGQEDTTPAEHISGDEIQENNVWVYYLRLHFDISADENDEIDADILAKEMLICDEHLEVIADYTIYKLLSKIDIQRAAPYKSNFDEWLREAKYQINRGRARITKNSDIRDPYLFETPTPTFRA